MSSQKSSGSGSLVKSKASFGNDEDDYNGVEGLEKEGSDSDLVENGILDIEEEEESDGDGNVMKDNGVIFLNLIL